MGRADGAAERHQQGQRQGLDLLQAHPGAERSQNGDYSSKTNMKDRLAQVRQRAQATRRQYVQAVYDAVGTHVTMD
jgi:hypothetical protein